MIILKESSHKDQKDMIKKTIKKKKENRITIYDLFIFNYIYNISIKFPTRRPKELDRSVYSHLACSIMALQRGDQRG